MRIRAGVTRAGLVCVLVIFGCGTAHEDALSQTCTGNACATGGNAGSGGNARTDASSGSGGFVGAGGEISGVGGNTPATGGADAGAGAGGTVATGGASGTGGTSSGCTPTNGGVEICDGVDNDCDGKIDEPLSASDAHGIDFTDPVHCGTCSTNCRNNLKAAYGAACHAPPTAELGLTPGTCDYTECAVNSWDVDGNRTNGCEHYCPFNPGRTVTKDVGGAYGCGKDDDCNGLIDDGLNLCSDPLNCGSCGMSCVLSHASASCQSSAETGLFCDANNTKCVISQCDPGWADSNHSPEDGCEVNLAATGQNGPEICDGFDNDGDGKIDEAGAPPDGTDGTADPLDPTRHLGDACGSNVGACKPGQLRCRGGVVLCVNAAVPQAEFCDGIDNDCNGKTDDDPAPDAPLCGPKAVCVRGQSFFECAAPCGSGEFPCPTGFTCERLTLSANPTVTVPVCVGAPG